MNLSDIRQSFEFANFMKDLDWQAEKFENDFVYLKKFPFIGSFAKYPRPSDLINTDNLVDFVKNKKIFRLKISPFIRTEQKEYSLLKKKLLKSGFKIDIDPFNPTTTIRVDLTRTEKDVFKSFSEAKRRAVRRAIKYGISISVSSDIDIFIKIRQQQFAPLGFLVTKEMKTLWSNFYPKKADLLLAKSRNDQYIAGILLLYHNNTSYYWYASSLKTGKKMFAPSLLVWEAIKKAKKRGCRILDFEGVYDERFPKASESWRGFTKFKEGFSDEKFVFMENFIR